MEKYFNSYKNRNVLHGQRVHIYRNLKFKDEIVYSIRDASTKLVLGHATNILLSRCIFTVNQAGRARVLKEKRKNVCGWIEGSFGTIQAYDNSIFTKGVIVKFNPYKNEKFVYGEDNIPINTAGVVYINDTGVYALGF